MEKSPEMKQKVRAGSQGQTQMKQKVRAGSQGQTQIRHRCYTHASYQSLESSVVVTSIGNRVQKEVYL